MTKDDIKDNFDNMILQVCKYIKAAGLSNEDDFAIKVELGLSLLVSAIDMPEDINNIKTDELKHAAHQIAKIVKVVEYALVASTTDYCMGLVSEDRKI